MQPEDGSPNKGNSSPNRSDGAAEVEPSSWCGKATEYPRDSSIPALLRECVARTPDKIALVLPTVDSAITVSFKELDERSDRLASELAAQGVGAGDRVALLMNRSIEAILGMCAVLKRGAAYVPLDPAYPLPRLQFMLDDVDPKVVLSDVQSAGLQTTFTGKMIVIESGWGAHTETPTEPTDLSTADSIAYLMYTSGSTGTPKGVSVPQRAINRLVRGSDFTKLDQSTVFLQLAPLSFDASTLEIWGPLLNGGTCVLYPSSGVPDLEQLRKVVRDHKITSMWLTATLFNLIIDQQPDALETVEELLTGGEALSVPHIRKAHSLLPRTQLINGYGPTENTTFTCCYRIPRKLPANLSSIPIGKPIANTQVHILDEAMKPVTIGQTGELLVGGDGLALGYWHRDDLTSERFIANPFSTHPGSRLYRTGDKVRWLPTGIIEFVGRVDDQVKLSGYRIELGEISAVLGSSDMVREATAIVRSDQQGHKRLVAYYVPRKGRTPTAGDLLNFLQARLPEPMLPSAFVAIDRIPLTPNGKTDRDALPEPSRERPILNQAFLAPRDELESTLAELWCGLLEIDRAGVHDRFFELGGTSLLAAEFIHALSHRLGEKVSLITLFNAPTIASIADVLREQHAAALRRQFPGLTQPSPTPERPRQQPKRGKDSRSAQTQEQIAVVGMAGRFPKAPDVFAFWENLKNGVEGSTEITAEDLRNNGEDPDVLNDPDYVAGTFALEDADRFDAAFFGFTPREAELMDPQLRLMLEVAWSALENAGYDPYGYAGKIGVFGGVGRNSYLLNQMIPHAHLRDSMGDYHMLVGNERDFPTTHISYRLNLRGPSINVQSACSTSGVAIHLAMQSLRRGDCDMALVGGCKIICPNRTGYWYVEGGPLAPEPKVRAFDAKANGMVRGSGAAMLLLKRLPDAHEDRDFIYGIIKGSAVNNDGANKIGFTAPSMQGQAEVIADALHDAGLTADDISYVEAHGTGTKLGDPIEVAGLTKAFRESTSAKTFCGLGSVKTNIGHLDAGATAAGVIKTLLSLQHQQLPPSLNYSEPNPEIDFANSPFYVNASLKPWPRTDTPRRAGVSSFGLGGTNAHLIIEEAPLRNDSEPTTGPQLLLISGKTATALEQNSLRLGKHLESNPDLDLCDVSHTLQVGRHAFASRRILVSNTIAEASLALQDMSSGPSPRADVEGKQDVAFMFPGGGAQYVNMARELYQAMPAFKQEVDLCAELLEPIISADIRNLIYPDKDAAQAGTLLEQPSKALPALFTIEYALARLWISWGIQPKSMIGHSMGEYVAACLSGVMTLEAALAMVSCRGRLFETLDEGAMLSVPLDESQLRAHMTEDLSFAAVNRPNACVVSGSVSSVETLEAKLDALEIEARRVHIRVAAHSLLVEPILAEFEEFVQGIELHPPKVPFVSNVTGTWIQEDEATDPAYWARHLRHTVRFSDGLATLCEGGNLALLEVGPGQTLSTFARQHPANPNRKAVTSSLRHPQEEVSDRKFLLTSLGNLWLSGVEVDWQVVRGEERPHRVGLPSYAFERKRHWIDVPETAEEPVSTSSRTLTLTPTLTPSDAEPATSAPPQTRRERILAELRGILADLSGLETDELDSRATFLELGFDSLFLAQANTIFKKRFGIRMTARQLLERTPNLDKLSEFLDGELPETAFTEQSAATGNTGNTANTGSADKFSTPESSEAIAKPDATSPWQPVQTKDSSDGLTQRQREHLDELIAKVESRTPESKRRTQETRPYLADPRTVQGFRSAVKEMIYPIISDRAEGARIWDLDGNEYIDLVSGYGVNFFGHCPDFIIKEVEAQIRKTVAIGPQTPLAGEVAQLVNELTGMERVAFCNTGSEAVLAAIRMARTVTGKKRLACFAGHYHGIFDEVLVKGLKVRGKRRTVPIAPGIPPEVCADVLVMDYGDPESFDLLREHADDIALVMLEPVRSREPEKQPVEFVRELRKLTEELNIPLLFDEMVTGFRSHPGGAQALWGIRADLATYGKVVGGGFPIGIIAGSSRYMDALDGGMWRFGDDSQPEADMTWFAGTFVRHPAALAAAKAVLLRLKQEGPALQERLAARTARFAEDLNQHFSLTGAPIRIEHFSSFYVVNFSPAQEHSNLLYHHLHNRGVYTYGGRPAFLTTEHSDADMVQVATAFKESVAELQRAGFFPGRPLQGDDEILEIPLSDGQQEIWLATRFGDEASLAFNLSSTIELTGTLHSQRLQDALDALVARHESLRTTPNDDGQTQRVLPASQTRVSIEQIDLTTLSTTGRATELQRLSSAEVTTLFDLQNGPLLRAKLIRLTDSKHLFILTAHHIIADGWACGVMLREIGELYAAACQGVSANLTAPMQLSEWVEKCETDRNSEAQTEAIDYWLSELKGPLPVLELPTDRPRPLFKTFGAKRANLDLDAAFTTRIKNLAVGEGATTFVTLLSAFQLFLNRLSAQEDFILGFSLAGQSQVQGRDLVGHCVNFLPLRTQVNPDASFSEHLIETRGKFLDALENQNLTFGTLIKKLRLKRDPSRVPLVSISFNMDPSSKGISFHDLDAQPGSIPRRYENFDMFFNVVDLGEEFQVQCTYNEDLWDATTMSSRLDQFHTFLSGILANPGLKSAELPILSEAEKDEQIRWNDTAQDYPLDKTIHGMFHDQVEATPEATALVFEDATLSYRQLDERSNQLARHLRSLGVDRGSLVAISLERSLELVVGLLGIMKAGGAYVPLDPDYPAERLAYMLQDMQAPVLLTQSHLLHHLPDHGIQTLSIDTARAELDAQSVAALDDHAGPDDLAYVIYTSGSTGKPKGVMNAHRGICNRLLWMQETYGLDAGDSVLQKTPFSFDVSVWEFFWPLMTGARLVIAKPEGHRDNSYLIQTILEHRITTLHFVPSMLQLFLENQQATQCRSLKRVFCSGEELPLDVQARFFECLSAELHNLYGPTEAAVDVTSWACDRNTQLSHVPIGRPIANTKIYILDQRMQPVPIGVSGELHIGGVQVATGYLNRPELTAEKFVDDPFSDEFAGRMYKTGDLARFMPDGNIEFLGRLDHQVKLRGFRIELGEIEAALTAHSDVEQAVVLAREDTASEKRLVAYLVHVAGKELSATTLRLHLKESLPDYMVPQHFVNIVDLPLTPNGKLDRNALPEPSRAAQMGENQHEAPRTEEERELAGIWSELLEVPNPGIRDDFFEVGGHSLMAIRMLTRIREAFGVEISLQALLAGPTIADLASNLQAFAFVSDQGSAPSTGDDEREELEF